MADGCIPDFLVKVFGLESDNSEVCAAKITRAKISLFCGPLAIDPLSTLAQGPRRDS